VSTPEAREEALSALYAAETTGEPDAEGLPAKARRLVDGVWTHRADLDATIASYATGWRVERMPAIDRNILRIGTYELLHTSTPAPVVINEAVELAKRFSTTKSGAFINGVLEAVRKGA